MRHALFLTFCIVLMVLLGCATPSYRITTDATNYREKLSIEKEDYEFYVGEYVGSEENCFPPIENRICIKNTLGEIYKPSRELNLELFSIKIRDKSLKTSEVVKDMANLTAAELAEQRGFKTFTPLYTIETYSCSSMYSDNTDDNVTNISDLSEDLICANLYSIRVLLFDEQADLKQGVLSRSRSNNLLQPFRALYIGTTPELYEEDAEENTEELQENYQVKLTNNDNAWKSQYDIRDLIDKLRKQYGLKKKLAHIFKDQRDSNEKWEEQKRTDPLEKFNSTQ